jgi:arsenate reductase (thioredoxin)
VELFKPLPRSGWVVHALTALCLASRCPTRGAEDLEHVPNLLLPMKQVLFVCFGNSCRSPMAEGFANHCAKGWLTAHSAGTNPAGFIMPNTVAAMQEKGIDISQQASKSLATVQLKSMNWIVIMEPGIARFVPRNLPRVETVIWPIPDPVGQPMDIYRRVRDQIELSVLEFLGRIRKSS